MEPVIIRKGSHYLKSNGGHFDFGPPIGEMLFHGRPMGPGDTDTIYERLEDIVIDRLGASVRVPIEMTAVALQSSQPVVIDGKDFDVSIYLTPNKRSTGEMTVMMHHEDDGTHRQNGVYDTNVAIFFTAEFTPHDGIGDVIKQTAQIFIQSTAPGAWSLRPPERHVTVSAGPEGRQTTNFFLINQIPMLDLSVGAGGRNVGAED